MITATTTNIPSKEVVDLNSRIKTKKNAPIQIAVLVQEC